MAHISYPGVILRFVILACLISPSFQSDEVAQPSGVEEAERAVANLDNHLSTLSRVTGALRIAYSSLRAVDAEAWIETAFQTFDVEKPKLQWETPAQRVTSKETLKDNLSTAFKLGQASPVMVKARIGSQKVKFTVLELLEFGSTIMVFLVKEAPLAPAGYQGTPAVWKIFRDSRIATNYIYRRNHPALARMIPNPCDMPNWRFTTKWGLKEYPSSHSGFYFEELLQDFVLYDHGDDEELFTTAWADIAKKFRLAYKNNNSGDFVVEGGTTLILISTMQSTNPGGKQGDGKLREEMEAHADAYSP